MLADERCRYIADCLREEGYVKVEALARETGVSPMTIRRDLDRLCGSGEAERCHGGARLPQATRNEVDYASKSLQNREQKMRIARRALGFIEDGDTVFLDSGTTTGEIARLLGASGLRVRVVTNDLFIAQTLLASPVPVTIIGGEVQKGTGCTTGYANERFLRGMRFSKAFVGAASIDRSFTLFSPTDNKAAVKRILPSLASQAFLVADADKFYSQALYSVCPLRDFTGLITDRKFSCSEQKALDELDITIVEA